MKKSIIAVFVAATAVLSVPAIAAGNTAQVVVQGSIIDDTESCNVTTGGAIVNNTVVLDDIKANELEKLAVNSPSLAFAKDVIYKVTDCKTAGQNFTGSLNVKLSGSFIPGMSDVLSNDIAINPAGNAALTLINYDLTRINFDGSDSKMIAFTPGDTVVLRYKATYVKTANNVTPGTLKGTTVMTISY